MKDQDNAHDYPEIHVAIIRNYCEINEKLEGKHQIKLAQLANPLLQPPSLHMYADFLVAISLQIFMVNSVLQIVCLVNSNAGLHSHNTKL